MKKFISLIAALAVSASSFVALATVASAETAPRVVVSATEVDFSDAAYASYADDFDWSTYNDPGNDLYYKTYDVAVKMTGIELATESYKSGKKTMYRGTSLITSLANFSITTAGERGDDWDAGIISTLISGATTNVSATSMGVDGTSTGAVYPAPGTALEVANTDEITIFNALVVVDESIPLTLDLVRAGVTVASFDTDLSASKADSSTEYDTIKSNFPVTGVSLTLPVASAPTTYTYTFKNIDGTADIEVQSGLAAGATVTAPTAPTVAGKTFDHWSDAVGGAAVDVDATASDNKTYYAVYVDAAPEYETVAPSTEQTAKVAEPGAAAYTNYSGDSVTLSKNYAIARFQTGIDGSKKYQIHATDGSVEKDFDVNFGLLEVSGTANFIAIIKGAPKNTVMELRVK